MKHFISTGLLVFSIALSAYSQKFYSYTGMGYYFPIGGDTKGVISDGDNVHAASNSLGNGPCVMVGVGYMFSKIFGLDLAGGYLLKSGDKGGSWTSTPQKAVITSYVNEDYRSSYNSTSLFINPSLTFRGNSGKRLVPYGKMGFFLGLNNKVDYKSTYTKDELKNPSVTNTHSIKEVIESNYSGNSSVGVTSNLGIDLFVSKNKNFGFFFELSTRLAQWNPSKVVTETSNSDIVKDINNVEISNTSSHTSTTTNLVKTLPYDYTGPDKLTQSMTFNGFALSIGVKWFILSNKSKQ